MERKRLIVLQDSITNLKAIHEMAQEKIETFNNMNVNLKNETVLKSYENFSEEICDVLNARFYEIKNKL